MHLRLGKKGILCFIFFIFTVFFVVYGIFFFFPFFLERRLLPLLSESIGFPGSACEVRKFSLTGLDLASLQLGYPENPFLSLDSVRLDYSLFGLLRRHVKKVVVSGVEIRIAYKDGSFMIPGIDMKNFFKGNAGKNHNIPNDSPHQFLPLTFGEFEIRNATIILTSDNSSLRIPFGIKARPFLASEKVVIPGYDFKMWFHPDIKTTAPALKVSSRIDIHTRLNFLTHETGIQLNISELNVDYKDYRIRNSPGSMPLTIDITKKQDALHAGFSRFCILSPFPIELSMDPNTACRIRSSPEGTEIQGEFLVNFSQELWNTSSPAGLQLLHSEAFPMRFTGTKSGDTWHFLLNLQHTGKLLQFQRQTDTFSFSPQTISIQGKGIAAEGTADFSVRVSDVTYNSDSFHADIKDFQIYGNMSIQSTHYPVMHAFTQLTDAKFTAGGFSAERMNAIIPFQWPAPSQEGEKTEYRLEEKRFFTVGAMKYHDMDIGTISAIPSQQGTGLCFTGQHRDFLSRFCVGFSARAEISDEGNLLSEIDFQSSYSGNIVNIDLGKFSPHLSGIYFEGNLGIKGKYRSTGSATTSSALIAIQNSRIDAPERKITLAGIDLDLEIKDLLNFRSAPDQILKFNRFSWGDIEINDGEAEFEIDSSCVFLRKSSFSWCNGHVYTHGLQIKSGKRDIDIICICDRLTLATLLRQLNLAFADGEGAVNGRIPIRYKEGKIRIHDGFLYSTPGKGGTIRFHDGALSPGALVAQQTIQLQIAQEALKNFTYDWAKLSLLSQDDNLLILMQMSGRPAGLMPFGFKKDIGLYKTGGTPMANFQQIDFHINFRLPLDAMLYYRAGISELLQ
jgi:hypothetical protein